MADIERARRTENNLRAKQIENARIVRDENNRPRVMIGDKLQPKGGASDGGGLALVATDAGGLKWEFSFQWEGKGKVLSLGPYSEKGDGLTLAEARDARNAARAKVRANPPINPITERRAAKATGGAAMTFGEYALREADRLAPRKKQGRRSWELQMTTRIGALAKTPLAEVETSHVKAALAPYWNTKPATSKRLRARIAKVLYSARADGLTGGPIWMNPAIFRGHLEHVMPKVIRRRPQHRPALAVAAVPAFLARLRAEEDNTIGWGLEWCILSAVRISEALNAQWGEVDLRRRVWTIPAHKMKGRLDDIENLQDHVVPLTRAMIRVLRKARPPHRTPRPYDFIFPSSRSRSGAHCLNAPGALMRELDPVATIHGFRASFFSWGVGQDYSERRLHLCLAHRAGANFVAAGVSADVDSAYNRDDQLAKRRAIMRAWSAFCTSLPPAVEVAKPEPLDTEPLKLAA